MNGELVPGSVLSGTYRVVRTIGRGGMGEVYEVSHLRTKASLALKVLLADSQLPQQLFQRFRREAEITSNLNHPNIVRVFDFDSLADGRPFLVMELLAGRELTQLLEPGKPLPLPDVVTIVQQIVQGLSAAHDRGIVHRDLKPGNVFLMRMPGGDRDRDLVKLLDFGISKVRGGMSNLTRPDAIMGTPNYMSPEQANGKADAADSRTDQFALAAIAYEMLTGRMAFPGDGLPSVLYRVVHEQPPKLRSWVPYLPSALEKVVNRGLSKRPDDRFPTIIAFAEAFGRAAERAKGSPAQPRPARLVGDASGPAAPHVTTLRSSNGQMEAVKPDPPTWRTQRLPRYLIPAGLVAAGIVGIAVLRAGSMARPTAIAAGIHAPPAVVNPLKLNASEGNHPVASPGPAPHTDTTPKPTPSPAPPSLPTTAVTPARPAGAQVRKPRLPGRAKAAPPRPVKPVRNEDL